MLRGVLWRCVFMGCIWMADLHSQMVEKALYGVRRKALRVNAYVFCEQNGMKIGGEDGRLGAFLLHRGCACSLPSGALLCEPMRLLCRLVLLSKLLCKGRVYELRLPQSGTT
jgi:hypothetical protein